jgi:hypothetical protein
MPETQYADSDGVSIAYQVKGEGPIDIIMAPVFSPTLSSSTTFPNTMTSFAGLRPLAA